MRRYAAIPDIGAGSLFIKKSPTSLGYLKKMLQVNSDTNVRGANNCPLLMGRKIHLHMRIDTKASFVTFYEVENYQPLSFSEANSAKSTKMPPAGEVDASSQVVEQPYR